MADFSLTPDSPLAGYSLMFEDTLLQEVTGLQLASVAVPHNGLQGLNARLQSLCKADFPQAGLCTRVYDLSIAGNNSTVTLLGLQADQCLLSVESKSLPVHQAYSQLQSELEDTAYLTDQSDSLAVLDVKGALALPALERIIMLDLSVFSSSTVARTMMEHLSVIIELPSPQHARLYSPRSSAKSFLHAVQTSLNNVCS